MSSSSPRHFKCELGPQLSETFRYNQRAELNKYIRTILNFYRHVSGVSRTRGGRGYGMLDSPEVLNDAAWNRTMASDNVPVEERGRGFGINDTRNPEDRPDPPQGPETALSKTSDKVWAERRDNLSYGVHDILLTNDSLDVSRIRSSANLAGVKITVDFIISFLTSAYGDATAESLAKELAQLRQPFSPNCNYTIEYDEKVSLLEQSSVTTKGLFAGFHYSEWILSLFDPEERTAIETALTAACIEPSQRTADTFATLINPVIVAQLNILRHHRVFSANLSNAFSSAACVSVPSVSSASVPSVAAASAASIPSSARKASAGVKGAASASKSAASTKPAPTQYCLLHRLCRHVSRDCTQMHDRFGRPGEKPQFNDLYKSVDPTLQPLT
jgi:hypothetical protein